MFWCLGMYGSASTWTFNVVQRIARTMLPDKPVIAGFAADALPPLEEAAAATLVIKTHAAPAYDALAQRATAIIVTMRDPRDAVASLITHNKAPFELALDVTASTAGMCGHFSQDPRALPLKFEDRFFDDPATVGRIAARFPGVLSDADRARIFDAFRRDKVESFIAGLAALPSAETAFDTVTGQWDTYDPVSGWHRHHAGRKAEVGRWRRDLSAEQVTAIEQRLQGWMVRFGYAPRGAPPAPYTIQVGRYGIAEG